MLKELMKYLTAAEVAQRLGVTPQRVRALIREGRLPAAIFGSNYMVSESDVKLVAERKPGRPRGGKRSPMVSTRKRA